MQLVQAVTGSLGEATGEAQPLYYVYDYCIVIYIYYI